MRFDSSHTTASSAAGLLLQQAEAIFHEEMATLITRDAFVHPMKGSKPSSKQPEPLMDMPLEELEVAAELVKDELARYQAVVGGESVISSAWQAASEDGLEKQYAYLPSSKRYEELQVVSKNERLEAAKHSFEGLDAQVSKEAKRAQKFQDKLDRHLGGFMMKAKASLRAVSALTEEREKIEIDTEVFRTLCAREETAIKTRVEEVSEALDREKKRNAKLQLRYKELTRLGKLLDQKLQ